MKRGELVVRVNCELLLRSLSARSLAPISRRICHVSPECAVLNASIVEESCSEGHQRLVRRDNEPEDLLADTRDEAGCQAEKKEAFHAYLEPEASRSSR